MMFAIDCESTGLDLFHSAKPFFVTTCNENLEQTYWEWNVNPITREPEIPKSDLDQIRNLIRVNANWGLFHDEETSERHTIIGQNIKFDVTAFSQIGICETDWPWYQTRDTILAGHMIASNQPHNLTSMAMDTEVGEPGQRRILAINIKSYEDALQEACTVARKIAKEQFPEWKIAQEDMPDMPSVNKSSKRDEDRPWKFDCWLPRAMILEFWTKSECGMYWIDYEQRNGYSYDPNLPIHGTDWNTKLISQIDGWDYRPPGTASEEDEGHPWWKVLANYGNADSDATIRLWIAQRDEINRRGLWKIYKERLKILPVINDMERRATSMIEPNLHEITNQYLEESAQASNICLNIAKTYPDKCPDCDGSGSSPDVENNDKKGRCKTCIGTGIFELELPKGASPNDSLRTFCFDILKLPQHHGKKAKTDIPTLDKDTLTEYLLTLPQNSKELRFINRLLWKRKRDTSLTFLRSYHKFNINGLIHSSYNPTGTATLRFSCYNPNAQQISKQESFCEECDGEGCESCNLTGLDQRSLRYIFGPRSGREWWSLDAQNIELRLPAYESGETTLIELFEKPNEPPYYGSNHLLNFHTVYPDIWDKVLAEVGIDKVGPTCKKRYKDTYYQWVKNGGFAIQYGAVDKAGGTGTADRSFHKPGGHALLKQRFSNLEKLNRKCISQANKYGFVETIPDITVDPEHGYPLVCKRTERGNVLETIPLSYHIQSSAMWWTCKAMVRCYDQLKQWRERDGFDAYITMQVHDEIVFDFPKSDTHPNDDNGLIRRSNKWRIDILRKLMAQGGDDFGGIPTPVGCEYNEKNWSEGVVITF